jgi:hypothetical protein
MAFISVTTNVVHLALNNNGMLHLSMFMPSTLAHTRVGLTVVVFERLVFLLRWVIGKTVPEVPRGVREAVARDK